MCRRLGDNVVVKPLFGSEGRGTVRGSDPELASRTFRTLVRGLEQVFNEEVPALRQTVDDRGKGRVRRQASEQDNSSKKSLIFSLTLLRPGVRMALLRKGS